MKPETMKRPDRFSWDQNDLFDPVDLGGLREALVEALAEALVTRYRREHDATTVIDTKGDQS